MKHRFLGTDSLSVYVRDGGRSIAPGSVVDLDSFVGQGVTLRDATHPAHADLFEPVVEPGAQAQGEPKRRGRVAADSDAGISVQQEG